MKKVFLIIGAMATTLAATAQHHRIERHHHGHGDGVPNRIMLRFGQFELRLKNRSNEFAS